MVLVEELVLDELVLELDVVVDRVELVLWVELLVLDDELVDDELVLVDVVVVNVVIPGQPSLIIKLSNRQVTTGRVSHDPVFREKTAPRLEMLILDDGCSVHDVAPPSLYHALT